MAARWGMLAVVALLILATFGATADDVPPSALRVAVTAIVGLLAPLFWPGIGAAPARTVLRIVGWSAAAAGLAAALLRLLGTPAQPFDRIFGVCGMLMLVLLLAHAAVAWLERRWSGGSGGSKASESREMAGRTVATALALLGTLPLWLGPAGELASRRYAWAIDAVIGLSPLTHLAVAGGNDLLRIQWFYQHSNLAGLQFSYPALAGVAWFYTVALLLLVLGALALRGRPRQVADTTPSGPTKEKLP